MQEIQGTSIATANDSNVAELSNRLRNLKSSLDYLIELLEKQKNGTRRFLTKDEAAEYLGMSTFTLDQYQRAGTLAIPSLKIGGMVRYDLKDVERYCDALPRREQLAKHGKPA